MFPDDGSETLEPPVLRPDESGAMEVADTELDGALRRHSPRRRAAGIGVFGVTALLAAALVLHTAVGARLAFVHTPVAQTQRPAGVALLSNIAFGTLTLNGQRLGAPPQVAALRNGTNLITLSAPPFATRQCRVMWPSLAVLGGRCMVSADLLYVAPISSALDADYGIMLDYDGGDLPPSAAASARSTLDAAIGAVQLQTLVPSGQRIATAWTPRSPTIIASMAVAQPERAQLAFSPAAAPDCPAGLCAGLEFIPGYFDREPLGGSVWMLSVGISYTWSFFTSSGATIASVTYPTDAQANIALMPDRNGDGGWHLWQPAPPGADTEPQVALAGTICDWASVFRVALPGVPSPPFVGTQVGSGIEGCAFDLQAVDGTSTGTLVWRFGVLMAANDEAHARFPMLPLASADELRAVGA